MHPASSIQHPVSGILIFNFQLIHSVLYSAFQLTKKFLNYYLTASNGKGHGIHSPFVFDFIQNVLNDRNPITGSYEIEMLRKKLLSDNRLIEVADFGAGSALLKTKQRVIKSIAGSSLKSKKFSQLLSRVVQCYNPSVILELGTSFGITTSYLAKANTKANIYTLEGSGAIADIAETNFQSLSLKNINLIRGDFESTLTALLKTLPEINFAFIDGNHRLAPTLDYFHQLLPYTTSASIIIFDDIHWSAEMEEAWRAIQQHSQVTLSIDLFFIGIIFVNPDFKVKQHFKIRF